MEIYKIIDNVMLPLFEAERHGDDFKIG